MLLFLNGQLKWEFGIEIVKFFMKSWTTRDPKYKDIMFTSYENWVALDSSGSKCL